MDGQESLELGCGAARWSIGLARQGARPVGVDLSPEQLAVARRLQRRAAVRFPLVRGSAEQLPFRNERFDLAFSDWGALTFSDPWKSIPECARVLRRGGRLVFATSSPFRVVFQARRGSGMGRFARYPYFGLHRVDYPGEVNFQLPYGEWVALFRHCGLRVDRLLETRPPPHARSSYLSEEEEAWGRRWPLECIWAVTKE